MGNLRDQFKKANLLSDKDARRLAHEARVERTEKGRAGLEQEQAARQQELTAQREQQRALDRDQQRELQAAREAEAEAAAVADVLAREARKAGPGQTRWYFQTPDGDLPWLEVSPQEARELRAGMHAVVRVGPAGSHDYRLLPVDHARRVQRLRPEVVAFAPKAL